TSLNYFMRPPWADQGRWIAIAGAALMVLALPLLPPWLAITLGGGLGMGLLCAFGYLLISHHWWIELGAPAMLLVTGGLIAAGHRLWEHFRDLAYLADDGDQRPWWAEPRHRLRRLLRRVWERLRGRSGSDGALIAVAGAAALPDEAPALRAMLNKTRSSVPRDPGPETGTATVVRAPRWMPEAEPAAPRPAMLSRVRR
ncbi:MAG TPA: hypothetical protein PKA17_07600, partial [Phenylobacterium sp.]|nr:hypothetical protein [Phenylobacterium sp.]